MKRITIAVLTLIFLSGGSMAIAQMQPMKPAQPSQGQAPGAAQKPGTLSRQPMMGQGMMGQGGQGMMGMMCPMMGQPMMGMGPGMMGGMMSTSDPKAQARMLKFHGDMMKAMGEVMLKHAQSLEQEK
jgi:hypothetical protein